MQNRFPAYVLKTLQILNAAGYEAYVVGGAVRDLLLGLEPGDYDITTSGRPEQVAAVLRAAGYSLAEKLGENFGVVVASRNRRPCAGDCHLSQRALCLWAGCAPAGGSMVL